MRRDIRQAQTEEVRRSILEVLYESGSALRAKMVRRIADAMNASTSWDDFLGQIEYLAAEELVRVFPAGTTDELSAVDQARYLEMCKRAVPDSDEAHQMMLRIRQRGRWFIEGNDNQVVGVARR
jgi:hypothetical protein